MRMRLFFALMALAGFSLMASAVSAAGVTLNASCDMLGATSMADDHTAILLCAFPSSNAASDCASGGGCVWKPMSAAGCYVSLKVSCSGDNCCLPGFINKGSSGNWGSCYTFDSFGEHIMNYPPGGNCGGWNVYQGLSSGQAYVCCQS